MNDAPFFISHRFPIATAAIAAGFEVHVAAPFDNEAVPEIISAGITYHDVPLYRGARSIIGELKLIATYWRLVGKVQPDLVHAVTMKPVLYGGLVSRLLGVPAVIHAITGLGYLFLIEGMFANLQRAIVMMLYRFVLAHPNMRAIFQNPDDLELFINHRLVRGERAIMIRGCGVDLNLFSHKPEPQDPVVVLFPARIIGDKGIHEFINAAQILKGEKCNAIFRLVGRLDPDNPTDVGIASVRRWETEGWVEWSGFLDDMPGALAACHIVCMPSYREGLPRVLIEAAACGRPIVTTDVPGCREIVKNGENGLLVTSRNVELLADALRKLINDREMRCQMGIRGREYAVSNFSVGQFVHESLGAYRAVLGDTKFGFSE